MYILCDCLQFAIRVVGDTAEIQDLLGPTSPHAGATCPECHDPLHRAPYIDDALLQRTRHVLRELTPKEAHLALEGMGFPEERDCAEEIVRSVLQQSIRAMSTRGIRGAGRTVIDSITMEDGTTLFLTGSAWGALVYRIRKTQETA